MIHDEICTYEVCKLAKEKGFPQHIGDDAYIADNEYYDDTFIEGYLDRIEFIPDYYPTITAPTQSLLQRWLREEKKFSVEVSWFEVGKKYFWVAKDMNNHDVFKPKTTKSMTFYDTWGQALESGLKYALKELK